MSLFSKRVLPLTLLGAAAVLGGCVGEAPLEGDDGQETQPDVAEAADPESADAIDPDAAEAVGTAQQALKVRLTEWQCQHWWNDGAYHTYSFHVPGLVEIWWGHTENDAVWACNQWLSGCREKGCGKARHLSTFWTEW
ncbi:hypothetical protein [Sorangium sp. So ce887]|uniref:hypothetical protein n=1 Tax=Sorangium sp. So ce887 TaxID=3133324 RepID=UPI003F5FFC2B